MKTSRPAIFLSPDLSVESVIQDRGKRDLSMSDVEPMDSVEGTGGDQLAKGNKIVLRRFGKGGYAECRVLIQEMESLVADPLTRMVWQQCRNCLEFLGHLLLNNQVHCQ
ncbi:MAG TPA: hypothetical protein PLY87_20925 [Planctomycetaceae bacterium]|nr:hypothetical protein [Planctomycetaceae bacterium]HQZ67572.1 hypothetical protein [Planctomycetaceae bacterium]